MRKRPFSPKRSIKTSPPDASIRRADFFTFLDSAAVLTPWFRRLCLLGLQSPEWEDQALLDAARSLGLEAEEAMRL